VWAAERAKPREFAWGTGKVGGWAVLTVPASANGSDPLELDES
jgi:hypothetical protein